MDERYEQAIQYLVDTGIPRDQAERMVFKQHEREAAARLMLGPDDVALHRETIEQLQELLEVIIARSDGNKEYTAMYGEGRDEYEGLARDAVNILPHIKLALARSETADD